MSFTLVSFLLDRSGSDLRLEARGSTSFVVHLAGGLLFGPFWGGLIAGSSTALAQAVEQQSPLKAVFNSAQRMVCVAGGVLVVYLVGASVPIIDFVRRSVDRRGAATGLWYFLLFAAG
ncbi:MAG: hypothetical protein IPI38_06190 [Gemmatimonadetes bacterium]|nr:hypothetical protein [Gemmatimonadota bacterium]